MYARASSFWAAQKAATARFSAWATELDGVLDRLASILAVSLAFLALASTRRCAEVRVPLRGLSARCARRAVKARGRLCALSGRGWLASILCSGRGGTVGGWPSSPSGTEARPGSGRRAPRPALAACQPLRPGGTADKVRLNASLAKFCGLNSWCSGLGPAKAAAASATLGSGLPKPSCSSSEEDDAESLVRVPRAEELSDEESSKRVRASSSLNSLSDSGRCCAACPALEWRLGPLAASGTSSGVTGASTGDPR